MWFSESFCKIIWLSLVGVMLTGCGGAGGGSSATANSYDGNWTPQYFEVYVPTLTNPDPPICIVPASAILAITNGSGSISFTQPCIDKRTSAITHYISHNISVNISSAGVIKIDSIKTGTLAGTCISTNNCKAEGSFWSYSLTRTTAKLPLPAQPPVASHATFYATLGGVWRTGSALTGGYFYSDANNDPEGVSTFVWKRDGVEIAGATSINYTLTAADFNTIIAFWVTPVAQTGTYLTGTQDYAYTASPITAGIVQGGLTWSNAKTGYVYNWADANAYCTTNTINAFTGWRLPTASELNSYMLSSEGKSSYTSNVVYWSSTLGSSSGEHQGVYRYLFSPVIASTLDSTLNYAVCVR